VEGWWRVGFEPSTTHFYLFLYYILLLLILLLLYNKIKDGGYIKIKKIKKIKIYKFKKIYSKQKNQTLHPPTLHLFFYYI
jgi:hypothetical protein